VSRSIATGLLALALAGGLAVPLLPCVPSASPGIGVVRALGYGLGGVICHQRPERSLATCGQNWPVCGRCGGLYLGAAAGALLVAAGVARRGSWRQWRARVAWAAAPTLALWTIEAATGFDPGTGVRFAAALPLGVVGALWLGAVARGDLA
jgi:Predicted membrane protein (DUF2085)